MMKKALPIALLVGIVFVGGVFSILPGTAQAWNLQGSCTASPTTANVGDTITWSATQTSTMKPSEGHYEWVWSGDDSLSGTTQSVGKAYTTAGTKNATVIIKMVLNSGLVETITRNCSVVIKTPPPPQLNAVCAVAPSSVQVGQSVTYTATATGGTGTYTYSWSGDESLSGTAASVSKTYANTGTKTGTVVVTSGSQSITKNCTVTVTQTPPPFDASCAVSPSSGTTNDTFTWSATASGGSGNYTYSWSGDEGLTGTTQTVNKQYSSAGTKAGTVVVTSGSSSLTRQCTITVTQTTTGCTSNCGGGGGGCTSNCGGGCTSNCGGGGMNQPTVVLFQKATKQPLAFVYLSQIPYTGLNGSTTVIAFFIGLALWAAGLVVVFRSKRIQELVRHFGFARATLVPASGSGAYMSEVTSIESPFASEVLSDYSHSGKAKQPPINLPVGEFKANEPATPDLESDLAIRAKRDHTLISPDGLNYIIEKAFSTGVAPSALLDQTIDRAKTLFTREDGWLLLNKAKVLQAIILPPEQSQPEDLVLENPIAPQAPVKSQPVQTPVYHSEPVLQEPVRENREPVERTDMHKHVADVNTFVNLLVRGDEREVFSFLRNMREGGYSVEQFVRTVVLELDEIFRGRIEREAARNNIVLNQITSKWSEGDLERVIGILLTIVDQSYKDAKVSAKLASMRIASLRS